MSVEKHHKQIYNAVRSALSAAAGLLVLTLLKLIFFIFNP